MDEQLEHRLTVLEDRSKGNSHRLDELERRQDNLDDLVSSVRVLASRQETVESVVKEIQTDVKEITTKSGKRWDSLIDKIILTIAAAVVGYILAQFGM